MDRKKLVWIFVFIGGTVGGYIPSLWGAGMFSFSSMLLSAVGSILGIYVAFKIGD